MIAELDQAIEGGELSFEFQPKLDLLAGTITASRRSPAGAIRTRALSCPTSSSRTPRRPA